MSFIVWLCREQLWHGEGGNDFLTKPLECVSTIFVHQLGAIPPEIIHSLASTHQQLKYSSSV